MKPASFNALNAEMERLRDAGQESSALELLTRSEPLFPPQAALTRMMRVELLARMNRASEAIDFLRDGLDRGFRYRGRWLRHERFALRQQRSGKFVMRRCRCDNAQRVAGSGGRVHPHRREAEGARDRAGHDVDKLHPPVGDDGQPGDEHAAANQEVLSAFAIRPGPHPTLDEPIGQSARQDGGHRDTGPGPRTEGESGQ